MNSLETKSSDCSQAGSEAGSETSETSDVSMKSVGSGGAYGGARDGGAGASMSSLVNRLHNGQTAATRAKAAEIQVLLDICRVADTQSLKKIVKCVKLSLIFDHRSYFLIVLLFLREKKSSIMCFAGKCRSCLPSQKYPTSGYRESGSYHFIKCFGLFLLSNRRVKREYGT